MGSAPCFLHTQSSPSSARVLSTSLPPYTPIPSSIRRVGRSARLPGHLAGRPLNVPCEERAPKTCRLSSQSTKCRSPFASRSAFPRSEIKFEARRPECARFCQANWPVRPEMALGRAPRGLTRRCRRRFHFFIAPRSALGAVMFSAHGAPPCSLLSGRILSEMKQQQQQQQSSSKSTCTTSTPGKRRGTPPCKKRCCITRSFSCSSSK